MKRDIEERQIRYMSQSIRLREEASPDVVRRTMIIVSLSIVAFVGWAAAAQVHEIARSPGEIIPSGYQQTVQHLEGGLVAEIMVREGDAVTRGQPLLRLDGGGIRKDLDRAAAKQVTLALQEERLRAFIDNRAPDFSDKTGGDAALLHDAQASFTSMSIAREKDRAIITDQISQKNQEINVLRAELRAVGGNLAVARELHHRRQELNPRACWLTSRCLRPSNSTICRKARPSVWRGALRRRALP